MADAPTVTGVFNYLGEMTEVPVFHTEAPEKSNLELDPHILPVHDIRKAEAAPTLEKEGFTRVALPLGIGGEQDLQAIAAIVRPPLMDLFQEVTKAPKIVMTPPQMRWSEKTPHPDAVNSITASYPHCDYTRDSFHELMRRQVEDDPEKDRWLSGRYAAYNVWWAVSPPPQDRPLAVIDRSILNPDDMVAGCTEIAYPEKTVRYGQGMVRYNPEHRWWYVFDMTPEDVLVFVGYDSADDELAGPPHSAFDNSSVGDRAVPRSSCEVRAFVFWGS